MNKRMSKKMKNKGKNNVGRKSFKSKETLFNKRLLLFFYVLIIVSFIAVLSLDYNISKKPYHLKLLAVSQLGNGSFVGRTADLYLEIRPGSGRVFIDTFPLTKLDTQISTRFAKDVACKEAGVDCSKLDFFYVIRSNSPIVGGPSASGAISALTFAALKNLRVNDKVTMTGTILSGALIGPVGGLKEKIRAAAEHNLSIVLIPSVERFVMNDSNIVNELRVMNESAVNGSNESRSNEPIIKNESSVQNKEDANNDSIDLVDYGTKVGIKVVPVDDIFDVVYYLTGRDYKPRDLVIDTSEYDLIMKGLALKLCNRSSDLMSMINTSLLKNRVIELVKSNMTELSMNESLSLINNTIESYYNLTERSAVAFNNSRYYAAASYCFGSGVKASFLFVLQEQDLEAKLNLVKKSLNNVRFKLNRMKKNYSTITQLQTFLIVDERLSEAEDYLKKAEEFIEKNESIKASEMLAWANERIFSAHSWMEFYNMSGKEFKININDLKSSCLTVVSEVNELHQYLKMILPIDFSTFDEEGKEINKEIALGNYELCLYKATRLRAKLNLIASTLGVKDYQIHELTKKKIEAAKRSIVMSFKKKVFPIMAYSYYDYAVSLLGYDDYSALVYAENAIELSNMDIYFEPKEEEKIALINQVVEPILLVVKDRMFLLGFLMGVLFVSTISFLFIINLSNEKSNDNKKKRYKESKYKGSKRIKKLKLSVRIKSLRKRIFKR